MKAVILAGGKGERIRQINDNVPKPMIRIKDIPVLEHIIIQLKKYNITDIIITVGYKAKKIIEYFKNGKEMGVNIEYYIEEKPMGSAGALVQLKNKLTEEFMVINGDIIFDIDLNALIQFHRSSNKNTTIVVHPNDHPYDSSTIEIDKENNILNWYLKNNRPEYYDNLVNAGIHMISPELLEIDFNKEMIDMDKDVLRPNINKIKAYKTSEYIKDMGTKERYEQVTKDYDKIHKFNRKNKQKAIFIDRDGTMNRHNGYITNEDQLALLPLTTEAIRMINESDYIGIIVTNQPIIARGEINETRLNMIHKKLQTILGNEGTYIDDIYYCPHHPDSGYKGEIKELKIQCECRKPGPGMLLKAARDYNIDLSKSWMIGDSKTDISAGDNAGCKSILINKEKKNYGQVYTVDNLYEGVKIIIDQDK